MCGRVGSIGKDNTLEVLLNGLKLLEYRGYDSCGIAYLNNNKVDVIKSVGRVSTLDEKVDKIISDKNINKLKHSYKLYELMIDKLIDAKSIIINLLISRLNMCMCS